MENNISVRYLEPEWDYPAWGTSVESDIEL